MQRHQSTSWSNNHYRCSCCFPGPYSSEHVCPILPIPEPTYNSDLYSSNRIPNSQNISQYHQNEPTYYRNRHNSDNSNSSQNTYYRYRHSNDNSNSSLSQNMNTYTHQQHPQHPPTSFTSQFYNQSSDLILNRLSCLFMINALSSLLSRAGSRIRQHNSSRSPSPQNANLEEFTVVIPVIDHKVKKNLNDSPMKNPPFWRRLTWSFLTILNVYTFIGSVFLMVILSINGNITKTFSRLNYFIIIIGTLEFAPRMMNIYQIHLYTNGKINFCEALAIMFGKKELYLLYGKHHISYRQISSRFSRKHTTKIYD
ncbi:7596_t:CDS:2, partial [Scutellospora calospora]